MRVYLRFMHVYFRFMRVYLHDFLLIFLFPYLYINFLIIIFIYRFLFIVYCLFYLLFLFICLLFLYYNHKIFLHLHSECICTISKTCLSPHPYIVLTLFPWKQSLLVSPYWRVKERYIENKACKSYTKLRIKIMSSSSSSSSSRIGPFDPFRLHSYICSRQRFFGLPIVLLPCGL